MIFRRDHLAVIHRALTGQWWHLPDRWPDEERRAVADAIVAAERARTTATEATAGP